MAKSPRQMRLTPRHVAYLQPETLAEDLPPPPPGLRAATPDDHRATIASLLGPDPITDDVWIFAYGSLIWKPACDFVEMRTGLVRGWHRSFCLGWSNRFRASDENPGLMLALDRGGACNGVLYRLPPDQIETCLTQLLEREMGWLPSPFPPRFVSAEADGRSIRAQSGRGDQHRGRHAAATRPAAAPVRAARRRIIASPCVERR